MALEYERHVAETAGCGLLIMGLGGQLIRWPASLLQGLVDRGFQVVVYDSRDAGLSEGFDGAGPADMATLRAGLGAGAAPPLAYTLDNLARAAVSLMDALGIAQAHVAGVSMGGMIAQAAALARGGWSAH